MLLEEPTSDHVFPTAHHGFVLNQDAIEADVPQVEVRAPVDGIVYKIAYMTYKVTGPLGTSYYSDYMVYIAATTRYTVYIGHLHKLDLEGTLSKLPSVIKNKLNQAPDSLPEKYKEEFPVHLAIIAGEVIGFAGGYGDFGVPDGNELTYPQSGFDLGAFYFRNPLPFVNPEPYEYEWEKMLYCSSPLLRYPNGTDNFVDNQGQSLIWRKPTAGYPLQGKVCYDPGSRIPPSLAGNWFKEGTDDVHKRENKLCFGWDPFDPTVPLISVGDPNLYFDGVYGPGVYRVTSQEFGSWPEHSSNPGDTNSYCFPVYAGRYVPAPPLLPTLIGGIFVAFISGNPNGIGVAFKHGEDACDNPPFPDQFTYFHR